jgi:hypothetical protein
MPRTLRYAFRSAVAWTILAEVIRRHGESRNLLRWCRDAAVAGADDIG